MLAVPDAVQGPKWTCSHLILRNNPRSRYNRYSHFPFEDIETERLIKLPKVTQLVGSNARDANSETLNSCTALLLGHWNC